jgi:hypothetical protein
VKKDYISEAKRLAVPPEIYLKLPSKALYVIDKRTPETLMRYWELNDFIKYLIEKYGLTKETFRSFIFNTNRKTQKDRELLVAWFFAKFISGLHNEKCHYALALPEEDTGIDCYIRIIDFDAENVAGLPIQVCDLPLDSNSLDESKIEEIIFLASAKAKAKPTDCTDAILLLHVLGRGDEKAVNIDRFKIRELFEKQCWSYRKIILQIDSEARNDFFTVYCDNNEEHFRGIRENRKSRIILGRTLQDEQKSGKLAKKIDQISFYI